MSWGISGSPWDEDFDSNEPWREGFSTEPPAALPPSGESFGHEPITINPSCCGNNCCGGREERVMCARCPDVEWPCTSAVVLGLVPRGHRADA